MTRKEQISNGFTEMMKGFWGNQDLKVPDFEEPCKQEPCKEQEIYEKAYKEGYDKGWSDGNFIGANRWIPISERLPEVNQRVLVTSYGRVCYAMMTSADGNSGHPVFRLQDSLNERVVCETTVHSEFTTSRIIAWMPLPESYKAESEE